MGILRTLHKYRGIRQARYGGEYSQGEKKAFYHHNRWATEFKKQILLCGYAFGIVRDMMQGDGPRH